jgi:SNF2 family DNA or RNA helicase
MVTIDINTLNSEFHLLGEIETIKSNFRAITYLSDYKNCSVHSNYISVPFDSDSQETELNSLRKCLKKYKIEFSDSNSIKIELEVYYRDQKNFTEFSQRAKDIWHNKITYEDFEVFTQVLENKLITRRLYPLQLLASYHMAFAQNACNFSVPGAGKTSVVYGAYAYLSSLQSTSDKYVNKILIIGPLSSFGPWENEYKECFGKKPYSARLSGGVPSDYRSSVLEDLGNVEDMPDIILMSYQSISFNLDSLNILLDREDVKYMIVLDEAHKIKRIEGGTWAPSVLSLANKKAVRSRIVLTGTPTPNGYEDIYNLYEFIWPNKEIVPYNPYQLQEMSSARQDYRVGNLIDSISPFFVRIKKSNILPAEKFPILNHNPINVELDGMHKELVNVIENRFLSPLTSSSSVFSDLSKAKLIRLQQASTNPYLLEKPIEKYYSDGEDDQGLHYLSSSIAQLKDESYRPVKLVEAVRLSKTILKEGGKVVLWGVFTDNLILLKSMFDDEGVRCELLYGMTPTGEDSESNLTREGIVQMFNDKESGLDVVIANPLAVAESISLHKSCHNAIYFERTYNAAAFLQSKDRIHRVGLKEGTITNYYYILSDSSIDYSIHQRLGVKEQRMINLIESNDIPLIEDYLNSNDSISPSDVQNLVDEYIHRKFI